MSAANKVETADTAATPETDQRYLCFSLGSEEYAIPLLSVKEVIAATVCTPIPQMPSYFLGIMNLRGQVISVVDLRSKLGVPPGHTSENAIIICDVAADPIGILVDAINSVLETDSASMSNAVNIGMGANAKFVSGVYRTEDRLVLLLDIPRILSNDLKLASSQTEKGKKAQ